MEFGYYVLTPNYTPILKLMNFRSDRDTKLHIYLDKICIASRHFEIRQLKGQVDSNDFSKSLYELSDCDPVSSLQIGWQERITVHYLVVPIDVANTPVSISAISFSIDNQTISTSVPQLLDHRTGGKLADFMCRERAHELFLVSQSLPLLFGINVIDWVVNFYF